MAAQQSRVPSTRRPHPRSAESSDRPGIPSRIRGLRPPHATYDRCAAIIRVLALWPHELEDESHAARQRIVAKLRRALRAERRRGLAGHWTYDLARHVELLRIYREELAAIAGRPDTSATPKAR